MLSCHTYICRKCNEPESLCRVTVACGALPTSPLIVFADGSDWRAGTRGKSLVTVPELLVMSAWKLVPRGNVISMLPESDWNI